MKKLLAQREKIDLLDEKISKLLLRRLDLSHDIIRKKRKFRLPVTDTERERDIFERITSDCTLAEKAYLLKVYRTILRQSKKKST